MNSRIFGVGLDLCKVDRVRRLLENMEDEKKHHYFTQNEIDYCMSKIDPYVHFSGRLAAKEAIYKALKFDLRGPILLDRIEITNDEKGIPKVDLLMDMDELKIDKDSLDIALSISHTEDFAMAFAVVQIID